MSAGPPPPPTLLLVDDRAENLLALEALLEPLGHETVRAQSGEEALRAVLARDFAVILMDVQMPGMNGFETARLIKSRERSRHTPIIFLTAISKDDEFVFEGYSVGAVDYMFKPFHPDVLRSKVSVLVDLHLKTQRLQEQERLLRDAERRELELRHGARLAETEARMAEVVGSAMDAIVTFDDERRVTLFNAAAQRMFGYREEEALGMPLDRLFRPPLRPELLDQVRRGARDADADAEGAGAPTGTPPREEVRGVHRAGDEFPVEASVSCLALPAERVYTVIARDVTERKRSEEELRVRQAELESAMAARSRFYASMSHELRTPINAILGYSSLLLDEIYGPLTPQQASGVERANRAARHLLELVNDILDLSKIEAGKLELEVQPVAFPALVEELFVTVRPLADEHGSELVLQAEGDPVTVVTDPRRVRQILLNLLSNAIKFGGGDPIRVRSRSCPDGGVVVSVADRGEGIGPEDQEKIFDEFVQLSHPGQQQGTGLGLPISRRLAHLLDGSLTVESVPGEGSTFTLALPAAVSHEPLPPGAPLPAGGAAA